MYYYALELKDIAVIQLHTKEPQNPALNRSQVYLNPAQIQRQLSTAHYSDYFTTQHNNSPNRNSPHAEWKGSL